MPNVTLFTAKIPLPSNLNLVISTAATDLNPDNKERE
jgi:hypothetical protein